MNAVVNANRLNYDRTRVLTPDHTQIEIGESEATVTIPHVNTIRQQYEVEGSDEAKGTCRELAQWVALKLVEEGIADKADVYACATNKEAHYGVIAEIDGQKYVVDLAYSQPVLEAIPVDGEDHISDAYSGAKGSKQAFSGKIIYRATEQDDGTIMFTVNADNRSTEFPFQPLTDELDKKIPATWAHATGSGYATVVHPNGNGTYRVDSLPMGAEATLGDEFKQLHEAVRRGVSVTVEFN